jgi:WD40 repeat protein
MVRWFLILLLGIGVAGGVAYYTGLLEPYSPGATPSTPQPGKDAVLGDLLFPAVELKALPPATGPAPSTLAIDPCHVVVREKQDISCVKDGQLVFVGHEVLSESVFSKPEARPTKIAAVFPGTPAEKLRAYRPWEEGDIVEEGQMLALVDPALAVQEVESKAAKIFIAKSELDANNALCKEAEYRLERLKQLRATGGTGAVSDEDMGNAIVTVDKYKAEKQGKISAVEVAVREKRQADILLAQHTLRNSLHGKSIVKKIYKFSGECLKNQEPVLQLHNISRLRIEGSIDAADFTKLRPGMQCYIEPSVEMSPTQPQLMKAHRGEVTSVAVCPNGTHFVSGSDDHTICVWQRGRPIPVLTLRHKSAVRVVACSPTSKQMKVAVGCADGTLCLWDLSNLSKPAGPMPFKDQHRGAVTALAFSPDGAWLASGSEDNTIQLWNASTGVLVYPFDLEHGVDEPHQGTITALCITPQCKLVSAARDGTLRVWTLHQKGARLAGEPIANRGGTINHLGVSHDGRYMLYDQGKTLQVLNVYDGSTACVLENLGGANAFDTLALFSPDGSLMLTGGAGEGRLHLWKPPTPEDRAYQVRELVTKDRSAITTAAFGPASERFAVTGSKDGYVHLWELPDETTVKNHRILADAHGEALRLDLLERALDASKTRIAVNVLNPQDRLVPGQRVTLVMVLPATGK